MGIGDRISGAVSWTKNAIAQEAMNQVHGFEKIGHAIVHPYESGQNICKNLSKMTGDLEAFSDLGEHKSLETKVQQDILNYPLTK